MEKDHAIIYNPMAGKSKKMKEGINQVSRCFDDLGLSYKLFETESAGHAIELASQLAKDGCRVIGAGGDGTCNEVMNGVITSNTGVLCGFIPMGSGNDIPGAIGILPDIKRACEIIAEGKSGKSDIGLANTHEGVKRYFLGIGSQGFDAEVTRRHNNSKIKSYVFHTIKANFPFKIREIIVSMDNDTYEGFANLVAVANGPSYGGGMYIVQTAKIDDGLFSINVLNIGKLKLLKDLPKAYSATLQPHPDISEYTSKKVKIEMKNPEDEPYLCQVDGELLGTIPVEYEIIKDGYEFIRPEIDEVAEAFKEKYGRYFYDYEEK